MPRKLSLDSVKTKKLEAKLPKPVAEVAGAVRNTADVVAEIVSAVKASIAPPPKKPRAKRILTEDQKNALRERLTLARQAKIDKRQAVEPATD